MPDREKSRRKIVDLAEWILAAGFGAMLVRTALSFGPPTLQRPPTVISRGDPARSSWVEFILFLKEAQSFLRPGADVAVILPDKEVQDLSDTLIALGALPGEHVVPPTFFQAPTGSTPEYVLVFGGAAADTRFEMVRRFSRGSLFRRRR